MAADRDIAELEGNATLVAELLKSMAHRDRLLVLCQLVDGEKTVTELSSVSSLSQSAFSQQLKVLRDHELVKHRKESLNVYYSLANPKIEEILSALDRVFCK